MNLNDIKHIAIIGSGTMGPGMGFCFARAGLDVIIYDPVEKQRKKSEIRLREIGELFTAEKLHTAAEVEAALGRISLTGDFKQALGEAQFVLEAVPEKMEIKHEVFRQIEEAARPEAVLATNTSGLSVTGIGSVLKDPSRLVGFHWVNPPELVPLVEVIRSDKTAGWIMDLAYDLAVKIGKEPIRINRDIPGFAMNRLQMALLREALHLVESGVLSAEDVDKAFKYGHGFRTSWQGPLETIDLGGLDIFYRISTYLLNELSDAKGPQKPLVDMVEAGNLGLKTGQGFYTWDEEAKKRVRKRDIYFARQGKLIKEVKNG